METAQVYCQNCRSQNSLRETHCRNCGTRLLLVVFPQSLQYDTNHVPSFYEDHLLERVSFLELRLVQLGESLKLAMEIVREQGKMIRENQNQVKSLRKIAGKTVEKTEQNKTSEKDKIAQTIERIVAGHDSPNSELFSNLLTDGVKLLGKNEEKEAFRMLERAALLSPRNAGLLYLIGKNYFFADKFDNAKKHLERAFEFAPDNPDILLLLGAIYADDGDTEKARRLLSILAESDKTSRVVNLIWGILAAFEENWTESVAAWKIALKNDKMSEINYLLGCAFFQQNELNPALKSFQNAISIDRKYSDAWFMQAVIYHLQTDDRARNMLENAAELKESAAQCAEFLRKNKLDLEIALPFQHFKKKNARLLSGGALRLSRFLKSEISQALE